MIDIGHHQGGRSVEGIVDQGFGPRSATVAWVGPPGDLIADRRRGHEIHMTIAVHVTVHDDGGVIETTDGYGLRRKGAAAVGGFVFEPIEGVVLEQSDADVEITVLVHVAENRRLRLTVHAEGLGPQPDVMGCPSLTQGIGIFKPGHLVLSDRRGQHIDIAVHVGVGEVQGASSKGRGDVSSRPARAAAQILISLQKPT